MGALVFVDNRNRVVTDSITVAATFGKSHAHVLRDIRKILSEVDVEWGVSNFGETYYTNEQNGQVYTKFILTEDGFTILVMSYSGRDAMTFKVNYIRAFRDMQARLQKPKELSRLELIEIARESELAYLQSQEENAKLQHRLQIQEPKVIFADAIQVSNTGILVREMALILRQNGINIGEKRLFERLREMGYLVRRVGTDRNTPTQRSMELGLFKIKETPIVHSDGTVTVSKTPKVTGKGQLYFVNLFKSLATESVPEGRAIKTLD